MPELGTIASIVLALGALVTAVLSRIKLNAEADVSIAKQAMDMVKEVRVDVERLKAENGRLRAENEKLRADLDAMQGRLENKDRQIEELLEGVAVLCSQVKQQGQEPWFKPKSKELK